MKSTLNRIATLSGLVLGAFALSAVAATWTPPSSTPPGGNVDAPVNVGATTQTKLGWLGVKGLIATDFTLATGTPAAGKVLTAIDSLGNATWAPVSASNNVQVIDDIAIPEVSGFVTVNHNLGHKPSYVRWVVKCVTADIGFSVGDEVEIAGLMSGDHNPGFTATTNNTGFVLRRGRDSSSTGGMEIFRQDVNAQGAYIQPGITTANWRLKVYYF